VEINRNSLQVQLSGHTTRSAGRPGPQHLGPREDLRQTLPSCHWKVLRAGTSRAPGTVPTLQRFKLLGATFATPLALLFLWWRLLDHLRIEWSINPQYAFGWAVPFLCLYLAWRRVNRRQRHAESSHEPLKQTAEQTSSAAHASPVMAYTLRSTAFATLLLLTALWLPIRLIQEANPEWRLVSWALAFEVIGLTLLVADLVPTIKPKLAQTSALIFPLCFMVVAVPWPSFLEEPLVQGLSRSTAALTSEALNLAGIPALQRGNLVEVGAGVVGIEEACCGIRSFQASLMLALFLAGYYDLQTHRRLWLVCAGWLFAFVLNWARTTLLAATAAKTGLANIDTWHDPVGLVTSLVAFGALALLARTMAKSQMEGVARASSPAGFRNSVFGVFPAWVGLALLIWLLLAEAATQAWYRAHERRLPVPIAWSISVPPEAASLDERPLSKRAKQLLRFDTARDIRWHDSAGRRWQAIFLYWAPGRVAARLANDHTPAICLSAAGRQLLVPSPPQSANVSGLPMRINFYVATDPHLGKVHVLYCIREDCCFEQSDLAQDSAWRQRLAPILAGRRNCGQRSLELAVWGLGDEIQAKKAPMRQLQGIVRLEPSANAMPNS